MKPRTLAAILTWGSVLLGGVLGRVFLSPAIKAIGASDWFRSQLVSWFPSLRDAVTGRTYSAVLEGAIAPWGGIVLGIAVVAIPLAKIIWSTIEEVELPEPGQRASTPAAPQLDHVVQEATRDAFGQLAARWEKVSVSGILKSHPEIPKDELIGYVQDAIQTVSEDMVPRLRKEIVQNLGSSVAGHSSQAVAGALRDRVLELVGQEEEVFIQMVQAIATTAWKRRQAEEPGTGDDA